MSVVHVIKKNELMSKRFSSAYGVHQYQTPHPLWSIGTNSIASCPNQVSNVAQRPLSKIHLRRTACIVIIYH